MNVVLFYVVLLSIGWLLGRRFADTLIKRGWVY